jgi:hypothetical protein
MLRGVASNLLKEADIELHEVLDDPHGEVQQMVVEDELLGHVRLHDGVPHEVLREVDVLVDDLDDDVDGQH